MLKIKELRRAKNQSQTELSEVIGVSLRTIQNYESGSVDVPINKLKKIAQHYDVTIPYLFGGKKEEIKEVQEIKEFDSLNIDKKLNKIYDLLEFLKDSGKETKNKIEANKYLIAQTNRSMFEQSMNFQEVLDELEEKKKRLKG
jgi:transcriptional regulator with XRE-family HTH domain